ncbi:MAG: hypothetical protein IKQ94_10755 [Bacteroidales bacterium]|nr:hypothetical protein [Bacteroidales bacterium]
MADKQVNFQININGNAEVKLNKLGGAAKNTTSSFKKLGDACFRVNNIYTAAIAVFSKVTSSLKGINDAYNSQLEAETKLGKVMQNTMGATKAQVESILMLASAQQRLGVVGDEVQIAGAQELATYLSKTKSLKTLIPVMNDMLAQQYGLNATQEQATQIASMLGKVMDGQVGALSRYGYKFDKTQEKILKFGTEEQRVATLTEVVSSAVGGMNERMAKTTAGRAKQLANSWGDLKEQVGRLGQDIGQKLIPAASKAVSVVQKWTEVPLAQSIAREKAELNALVDALIQSNGKEDERKRIIDELQAKYPDFLKNIDLEKASNEDLREELEKVNAEYDKRMRKAALERRLEKIDEDYADEMDDITKYEISIAARKRVKELDPEIRKLLPKGYGLGANGRIYENRKGVGAIEVDDDWLYAQGNGELAALYEEYRQNRKLYFGSEKGNKEDVEKKRKKAEGYKLEREIVTGIVDRDFAHIDNSSGTGGSDTGGSGTGGSGTGGSGTGGSGTTSKVKDTATDISSGGNTLKNFYITINDGLVKEVNNHFSSSSDNPASADGFMQRLSDALQMVVNDVNYAAS